MKKTQHLPTPNQRNPKSNLHKISKSLLSFTLINNNFIKTSLILGILQYLQNIITKVDQKIKLLYHQDRKIRAPHYRKD